MFSINLLVISLTTTTSSKLTLHGCALLTAYPLALSSHALHAWHTGWPTQTTPLPFLQGHKHHPNDKVRRFFSVTLVFWGFCTVAALELK